MIILLLPLLLLWLLLLLLLLYLLLYIKSFDLVFFIHSLPCTGNSAVGFTLQ